MNATKLANIGRCPVPKSPASPGRVNGAVVLWLTMFVGLAFSATVVAAFDSGSTGADGALNFSGAPGTIIDFDPATFTPPLDPDGDGVYDFTTINIPVDITVRLRAEILGSAPIHWLATGAVNIDGTLDLSGGNGHSFSVVAIRVPSIPGPGGFAGGIGSRQPNIPPQTGFGPGGGCRRPSGSAVGGAASHATVALLGFSGCIAPAAYGNPFVLPLIGGSGGAGGGQISINGAGGGAGGGAILIASNVSISVNGAIVANGGHTGATASRFSFDGGGGGSGGAIRLLAPVINGSGNLSVVGTDNVDNIREQPGAQGRVRMEAVQNSFTGSISGDSRAVTLGPNPIILPNVPQPNIRVASVDGQVVSATPRGSFDPVDVTIDNAASIEIVVEGRNIPLGTMVTVTILNETEGLQVVTSGPLAGTIDLSTATVTANMPAGFSRIYTRVTF